MNKIVPKKATFIEKFALKDYLLKLWLLFSPLYPRGYCGKFYR